MSFVSKLTRRDVLRGGLVLGAALACPWPSYGYGGRDLTGERCLNLQNIHTGEKLSDKPYWVNGEYQSETLADLNHLLRDHRNGAVTQMDPKLFDLLYQAQTKLGACAEFQIISGYRSMETNEKLRKQGSGVARFSLHTAGQAIDIRLPGCNLETLRKTAVSLKYGGVGFYPQSNFVHVDTGRVRYW